MDSDVVTEVPSSLKKLVRLVLRGFYTIEHVIVVDLLLRNPCVKEDDLADLLKFEKKQLRSVIAQLKNDRFVKARLRMETGPDGKATRQNYYYINYKVFVNVVKYKLDHMRRKIETEERHSTSRASFQCTGCCKSFTDLEADHLIDFNTGEFRCSFCGAPVEEDETAVPRQDSRLLLARFNEQIEPLYALLREVEDIKLAPELLEPEPTDLSHINKDASSNKSRTGSRAPGESTGWSGDATRNKDYSLNVEQGITVTFNTFSTPQAAQTERKEAPVWLVKSTVLTPEVASKEEVEESVQDIQNHSSHPQNDIMEALLTHEKKEIANAKALLPGSGEESGTSETDEEKPLETGEVGEMESDEDEEEPMVMVAGKKVSLQAVTEEHVAKMTPAEKDAYIQLGQELYSNMYD